MGGLLRILIWLGLGLAGLGLILLAWNRAFPLAPESFSVRRAEAVEHALVALEELGITVSEGARFHVSMGSDPFLERRLLQDLSHRQLEQAKQEVIGRRKG